jgi:hypothetical protein
MKSGYDISQANTTKEQTELAVGRYAIEELPFDYANS